MNIQTTTVKKYPRGPKPEKAVICLSRANAGQMCAEYSRLIESWGNYPIIVMGFHPERIENSTLWFDDNDPATIVAAREALEVKIVEKLDELEIPKKYTFLVGFSRGGALALELLAHSNEPYAGVVVHCGKIYDHENFPESKHNVDIVLTHNLDDKVYPFNEMFKPMEKTLKEKGYKFRSESRMSGGHFYQTSVTTPVIMNTLLLA